MKKYVYLVGAMSILLTAAVSYPASNLNLSKSNVNRLVYPQGVTATTATTILSAVDKLPLGADDATIQATVKQHLGSLKSSHGGDLIIHVLPPGGSPKLRTILIFEKPADHDAAAMKAGYDLKANKRLSVQ